MVKNETNLIFVKKKLFMKLFDPDKNGFPVSGEENPPYHVVKCSFEKEESVVLKKGFLLF